jgi:hypothetical protein
MTPDDISKLCILAKNPPQKQAKKLFSSLETKTAKSIAKAITLGNTSALDKNLRETAEVFISGGKYQNASRTTSIQL